jgi:hypothetical protein
MTKAVAVNATNVVFSASEKLTWREKIPYTYGAFTLTMADASIASCLGDSGYVLKNCN